MAAHDYDICNLALLAIGERQLLSSLSDTSEQASLCSVLYPQARDNLLTRAPWRFATRTHQLVDILTGQVIPTWSALTTYGVDEPVIGPDGTLYFSRISGNFDHAPIPGGVGDDHWEPGLGSFIRPGWAHTFLLPSDYLDAQYIFAGARPGQPGVPLSNSDVLGISQVDLLPAINGQAVAIPFEVGAWPAHDELLLFCDLPGPTLVYTAQIWANTDTSMFPAYFVEVLVAELAVKLALASPQKKALAQELKVAARLAYAEAKAAEGNAEQGDIRPDSRFISRRG